MRINDPALVDVNPAGYVAPAAISAAGNTTLSIPAGPATDDVLIMDGTTNGSRNMAAFQKPAWHKISVLAGTGAYLATLTMSAANAREGAELDLLIAMPASSNPTIELRNLTNIGTLLATLAGLTVAATYNARLRYDGANWSLVKLAPVNLAGLSSLATEEEGVVTLVNGQQSYDVVFGTTKISAVTKVWIDVMLNGSSGEVLTGHADQTTLSPTGFTFWLSAAPGASGAKACWKAKV